MAKGKTEERGKREKNGKLKRGRTEVI